MTSITTRQVHPAKAHKAMLTNIEVQRHIGYVSTVGPGDGSYSTKYRLVDDGTVYIVLASSPVMIARMCLAVISFYESRGLPIAANLFRAMMIVCKRDRISIGSFIRQMVLYLPHYDKYKLDIEKYLLLMDNGC